MRWLRTFVVGLVAAASPALAAPASDPAFLGITMTSAPGFCSISYVTPDSPAQSAGIMFGDSIYGINGVSLAAMRGQLPCTVLTEQIVAQRPGDEVVLDVRRGGQRIALTAILSTRAEVLHRRFVGSPMMRTQLVDLDDDNVSYDVGESDGRTTIVGWFMLESCNGCARVFDRIADGLRSRTKNSDAPPTILAVTSPPVASSSPRAKLTSLRKTFTSSVPLAVADDEVFDSLALKDSLRISFMVIDCRGVVRFVAPIAPEADDMNAAIDDILAAVEQAEHARTRR